jgi:hypothetical protein
MRIWFIKIGIVLVLHLKAYLLQKEAELYPIKTKLF